MEEARVLKEQGNAHFKLEEWQQAIDCYSQALKLFADSSDANVFYKNRAACYLKLENYEAAVMDCTRALELGPNDPKALFRRCQAYEALSKIEEAFVDAATLLRVDPKNTAIQPVLKRLNPLVQEKVCTRLNL
jgi:tetratricopeptide (TPR) repeat protein